MKTKALLVAAGLALAGVGMSTAADARHYDGDRYDHYDHQDFHDRDHRWGHDRDDRWRHDNGRHYGWDNGRGHRRCWTEYRHHHEVRVCR